MGGPSSFFSPFLHGAETHHFPRPWGPLETRSESGKDSLPRPLPEDFGGPGWGGVLLWHLETRIG